MSKSTRDQTNLQIILILEIPTAKIKAENISTPKHIIEHTKIARSSLS